MSTTDTDSTPARSRIRGWVLGVGALVFFTAAQLLYRASPASYRSVFAEDGAIYFHDVMHDGFSALFRPYNGYLVTAPRLLAIPLAWVPLDRVSDYLAVAGAIAGSLVALAVYRLTDQAIDSRLLRGGLAFAVALHPILVYENVANITNVIWVFTFAVFWALIRKPITRGDVALGAGVAFLGMASSSLCIIFVPVAAWIAWTRRDWKSRTVIGAYGLALLLQGLVFLTNSYHGPSGQASGLGTLYVIRVLGVTALGVRGAASLWNAGGQIRVDPFAAAVVVAIVALAALTRGRPRTLGLTAAGYSFIAFLTPLTFRGTAFFRLAPTWTYGGERYSVIGVLFLVASAAIMIPHVRLQSSVRTALAWIVVVQLVVVFALSFRTLHLGGASGPEWHPKLVAAARSCTALHASQWPVTVVPGGAWYVMVPCSKLRTVG